MLWVWNLERFNNKSSHQILASISCNLSAFIAGTCLTWLAPLALWLTSEKSEIKLTLEEFSWITCIIELGILLFVLPSGILADRYGRKRILLSVVPLLLATWILALFTSDLLSLYIIRFVQGIYVATVFTVAPMYVAEVSHPDIRGFLCGQFTVMLASGALFNYCTGNYLNYYAYLITLMILPVIFFIIFLLMPESPYYYFMIEDKLNAAKSYQWLSMNENSTYSHELLYIEQSVKNDMFYKIGYKDLIATKSDRKSLFIVLSVCITRCAIGLPTYATYGKQMFDKIIKSDSIFTVDQVTIMMSMILILGAFISSLISDTVGRRKLLIWPSIGIIFSNIIIAFYLYFNEINSNLLNNEWLIYLAVAIFCFCSNMSVGQLLQVVQAEFFPSHTRAKGGAITGITSAITTFFILKLYQTLTDLIGVYINYIIYALSAFISSIVIYFIVPESARKTFTQVNDIIKQS